MNIYRYMQSMELGQFPGLEIMCLDFGNQVIVYLAVRRPKSGVTAHDRRHHFQPQDVLTEHNRSLFDSPQK